MRGRALESKRVQKALAGPCACVFHSLLLTDDPNGGGPDMCVARRQSARRAGRALSRASREGGGQQHTATGPIRRPCCPERTCPRVRVYP